VRPSTLERIEIPREAISGAEEVYVDVARV